MKKIGVVVGSLRKNSFSELWTKAFTDQLPSDYEINFIDISQLALYNQEFDEESPVEYERFRSIVKEQDAIVFVTPEYNRSFSGVIKNAIDVASRPWGQNVWSGKPAIIISQSISNLSGVAAAFALKTVVLSLNMALMNVPELYFANSQDYFDDKGQLNNEDTMQFLKSAADAFVNHIEKHLA